MPKHFDVALSGSGKVLSPQFTDSNYRVNPYLLVCSGEIAYDYEARERAALSISGKAGPDT